MRMSYGKFVPARKYSGTREDGTTYSGEIPAGYSGLFRARISNVDETPILDDNGVKLYRYTSVSDHWFNKDESIFEIVNDCMENKYGCIVLDGKPYGAQYGFGGDECDGLIDFFAKERVKLPEPMKFEAFGKEYLMTWYYASYDDDNSESE